MKHYELVIEERQPTCGGKSPTRSTIKSVTCDDPVAYVRNLLKADKAELTVEVKDADNLTVFADCSGMTQKFLFTRI